jgi:cytochrome c5
MSYGPRGRFGWWQVALMVGAFSLGASGFGCSTEAPGDDGSDSSDEKTPRGDDDEDPADGDDEVPDEDDQGDDDGVKPPPKTDARTPTDSGRDAGSAPKPTGDSGAQMPPKGNEPGTAESAIWCNARAVLQTRCQTCHGKEVAGAPMSIVTWEDTQANGVINKTKKISELIKLRIHDTAKPMPPVAQGKLTSEEMAALDAWSEAGYPNGTCTTPDDAPAKPAEDFKWPAECTPDKIFAVKAQQNGQPYNVRANWEDNVTITVPVPWAGKISGDVQAIAIRPLTTNKRVVHHWILYAGTRQFITSWSPGKEAEVFPEDIGVFMPSSGTFQLNMHYYNQGNSNAEKDESGAEICLTDKKRPKTATTNMFGPIALNVPPGMSEAVATCTHNGTAPVTLITSSPHMHKTGVRGKFEIIRANGKVEVLDDSPFDQEDQSVTPINAVLMPGDKVRTSCTFKNDTGRAKRFGESTEDEMCFNFARYYPMGALRCGLGF